MAQMPQAIEIKIEVTNPNLPSCQDGGTHQLERVDNRAIHSQMIAMCRGCGIMITYGVADASGS